MERAAANTIATRWMLGLLFCWLLWFVMSYCCCMYVDEAK